MKSLFRYYALLALLPLALLSGGCLREMSQSEEEKEPHFIAGKSRVNAMDYRRAIESFQKALEANPRSAAAHFELGLLFDQKASDPAAAIYHYESYLKLRPKAENAEVLRQHILGCKQELARTVSLGPVTVQQQRHLERLIEENKRLAEANAQLADEITRLRGQLSSQNTAASSGAGETRQPPEEVRVSLERQKARNEQTTARNDSATRSAQAVSSNSGLRNSVHTTSRRSHTVRPGETLFSIAQRHGMSVDRLRQANPGVDPRRMQPGKVLVIP